MQQRKLLLNNNFESFLKNGTGKLLLVPFFLTFFLLGKNNKLNAQTPAKVSTEQSLLQFSGKVLVSEKDSLRGLAFVSILVKSKKTGAISDDKGFFTLVASPGDVIEFVSIGYKDAEFIIPDTLKTKHYLAIIQMRRDTIQLPDVSVYSYPTPDEFKEAFLKLNVPNDDLSRAQKNLAAEEMRELVRGISMDGYDNYRYSMEQRYQRLQYIGQYPPNQLLNPVAWAKFIKAFKAGKLKIK